MGEVYEITPAEIAAAEARQAAWEQEQLARAKALRRALLLGCCAAIGLGAALLWQTVPAFDPRGFRRLIGLQLCGGALLLGGGAAGLFAAWFAEGTTTINKGETYE